MAVVVGNELLGTSLTGRASTDTVTNREKERLKFLYPLFEAVDSDGLCDDR